MRHVATFFYIDALNSSFLTSSTMPFLSELATKHYYRVLENVVGYSFAIQSCMLSGKYPDETNQWMPYFYDPQESSILFKALKNFGPAFSLDKLPQLRYLLTELARRVLLRKGVHTNNVPFNMIDKIAIYPYYFVCEMPSFYELTELLKKKCQAALTYIGPPQIRSSIYGPLEQHIHASNHEAELIIAYDDRLDMLGHKFGPNSIECLRYARLMDSVLQTTYQKLVKNVGRNLTFVVFSDHGQCERTYSFNLLSELDKRGLDFGDDYFCFLDATLALFWPKDDVAQERIQEMLGGIHNGKVINEDLKEKYHIKFEDKRYGEIIFVLKPGGTFYPNFFSPFSAMRGLHGYLPEDDVQKGFLISDKKISHSFKHVKDFRDFALNAFSNYT